jgi:hypothetical protein
LDALSTTTLSSRLLRLQNHTSDGKGEARSWTCALY